MTLGRNCIFATLSIIDIQHKQYLAQQRCYSAECRDLYIVMLNVIMLNVIMLNVIMLNVIMLNVIMLSVMP